MRVRKAVIPAAGMGTRFLPATKAQPKEMLPLVDKPIIQYVVEEAVASGIQDILIITGRGKRSIEDHFDRNVELELLLEDRNAKLLATIRQLGDLADIHFIRQKQPLGLGHAIYQARRHVGNEPFAVLLGDEVFMANPPCLKQLLDVHERVGGSVIAVQPVPVEEVSRYGVIAPAPAGEMAADGVTSRLTAAEAAASGEAVPRQAGGRLLRAMDLVEKPPVAEAPSDLAIVGRYVLDPAIFAILAELPPGRNGEIQLTDGLRELNRFSPVYGYEPVGRRFDVGDKLGYIGATIELALSRPDLGKGLEAYLRGMETEGPSPARATDGVDGWASQR